MNARAVHYFDFLAEVENALDNVIEQCHTRNWDENQISGDITIEFGRKFKRVDIQGFERPFKILWDSRKLKGSAETKLGDIAIIGRMTTQEKENIEGVGLLEAKRIYKSRPHFKAAKPDQLERISKAAPHAHLLLYDYLPITSFSDNLFVNIHRKYSFLTKLILSKILSISRFHVLVA